jgi:Arm domain-containing DNA-binding protein
VDAIWIGHGLYLQVLSANNRSWLLRYEFRGHKRWMGLGSIATFSLDEARARARQARQLLADGIDPLEQRKAERVRAAWCLGPLAAQHVRPLPEALPF